MSEEQTPKGEQETATYTKEQVEQMIAEQTKGLSSKVEELLGETKAAKAKAKEEAEAREKAAEEAARKAGDTEALEKSWQEKLAKIEAEKGEALTAAQKQIQKLTKGAQAAKLAAEMAVEGSAGILERFIADRLDVDMSGEDPVIRVLDKAGKPSAMSLDDLKAEFSGDAAFAPLISGSKATGGGAAGANGGAGKPSGPMAGLLKAVPALSDLPEK